jgi:hypothetical protein
MSKEINNNNAAVIANNKKALGVCSIVFAILIALIGIILGIIGICRYPVKSTGWWLSIIGLSLGVMNSAIGLILQL